MLLSSLLLTTFVTSTLADQTVTAYLAVPVFGGTNASADGNTLYINVPRGDDSKADGFATLTYITGDHQFTATGSVNSITYSVACTYDAQSDGVCTGTDILPSALFQDTVTDTGLLTTTISQTFAASDMPNFEAIVTVTSGSFVPDATGTQKPTQNSKTSTATSRSAASASSPTTTSGTSGSTKMTASVALALVACLIHI